MYVHTFLRHSINVHSSLYIRLESQRMIGKVTLKEAKRELCLRQLEEQPNLLHKYA